MKSKIRALVRAHFLVPRRWSFCCNLTWRKDLGALSKSSFIRILVKQPTHWKRPWCWERLKTEGEEGDRGWDGWMASPVQWTWTLANSGRWYGRGRPGLLQSMGSQRVRHDLATEQQHYHSWGFHLHDLITSPKLITSQYPHIWRIGFSIWILGGHKHSVCCPMWTEAIIRFKFKI